MRTKKEIGKKKSGDKNISDTWFGLVTANTVQFTYMNVWYKELFHLFSAFWFLVWSGTIQIQQAYFK